MEESPVPIRRRPPWIAAALAGGLMVAVPAAVAGALLLGPRPAPSLPLAIRTVASTAPQAAPVHADWARPRLAPGSVIGQLNVPGLHFSGHFVEGTADYALAGHPGHVTSSAYPGEADNVVLFASREGLGDVTRLPAASRITLTTSYGTYAYAVTSTETLPASDTSPLGHEAAPLLTLATDNGRSPTYLVARARLVPSTVAEQEQVDQEVAIAQAQQEGSGGAGLAGMVWPVLGPITQVFGPSQVAIELPYVYQGVYYPRFHTGLDIAAAEGTPVHAAALGTVVLAATATEGGQLVGYGRYVVISHGGDYYTLYGHLSQINVRVGQRILTGDLIGRIGSTGRSTGPHLHFEVRQGRLVVDPQLYLPSI